jgi:PKD repeat protein
MMTSSTAWTRMFGASPSAPHSPDTRVGIAGTAFRINGILTNPGSQAEGLLLNSRMVQGVFDDENPATAGRWAYPDTGVWDPERNANEFAAALPLYAGRGLGALTVNLQGGNPSQQSASTTQPWIVTAFNPDGTLKPAWLDRLRRVIEAADDNGLVVILGLFYQAQDQRLVNEAAVRRAVDGVVDWLLAGAYANVLVEIANESNHGRTDHPILRPSRVSELIARVQSRSAGTLKASVAFTSGTIPPDSAVNRSDFVLLHGNNRDAAGIRTMIDRVRAKSVYKANPKPILFTEDSTTIANLNAAVAAGASWGFFDKGLNNYVDGFQSPPVNWAINTNTKQAFFARTAVLTTAPPLAVAEATPTFGPVPLDVSFDGTASSDPEGGVVTYAWDLDGDGELDDSTSATPTFTYTQAGSVTVELRVTDPRGASDTDSLVIHPGLVAPVADFTASPTTGSAPLTVNFTDTSTNAPTSWAWDFDDDGVVDSTARNPTHVYTAAGTYTVELTATNAAGSDTELKSGYVTVSPPAPAGPLALDSSSSAKTTGDQSSLSFSHTSAGANRLLVVLVSYRNTPQVNTVRYGGQSLTRAGRTVSGTLLGTEIWYLVNPPTGTGTVEVTLSLAKPFVAGALTFTGASQTSPLGPYVGALGNSKTPGVTVASAAGDIVVDVLAAKWASGRTAAAGAGQTQRWSTFAASATNGVIGGGSSEPAAGASVAMSWTTRGSDVWALVGVAIKPTRPAGAASNARHPRDAGGVVVRAGPVR